MEKVIDDDDDNDSVFFFLVIYTYIVRLFIYKKVQYNIRIELNYEFLGTFISSDSVGILFYILWSICICLIYMERRTIHKSKGKHLQLKRSKGKENCFAQNGTHTLIFSHSPQSKERLKAASEKWKVRQ